MSFGNLGRGCCKNSKRSSNNQRRKCCNHKSSGYNHSYCNPVDCVDDEFDCCNSYDCCCPEETSWCQVDNYNTSSCSYVVGNNANVAINNCDCEVQVDIKVREQNGVRVWGRITDCQGNPVSEVLVKLVKQIPGGYAGVAHTITDCSGFYQFEVSKDSCCQNYLILASKEARGTERVVSGSGNCKNICSCGKCH
ncbi:MAG: hypothetical protein RR539_10040 [Clostridium sp.]|uniref:hypothetical protein n=1 Tax=Clostridium sp. TaxID=1506 RepID=UPI002FC5C2C0